MPAHKIDGLWKFKKEQMDAWIEIGEAATVTQKLQVLNNTTLQQMRLLKEDKMVKKLG